MNPIDALLLNPLDWPLPKGMTKAKHRAGLEALREELAYLEAHPDDLARLVDEVKGMCECLKAWPSKHMIVDAAHRIRANPLRGLRRTRALESMMRSAPGLAALADGYAVEMMIAVQRRGCGFVVNGYQVAQWKDAASARRGHIRRLQERINRLGGSLDPADRAARDAALREVEADTVLEAVASGLVHSTAPAAETADGAAGVESLEAAHAGEPE